MHPILTVTLNPALDITTTTSEMLPHRKLRCGPPRYDPGGGGVNVSRAIRELDGQSTAFIAYGGNTGRFHRELFEQAGIDGVFWEYSGDTRISVTVMEDKSGDHYRFVMPGPRQDSDESHRLLAEFSRIIGAGVRYVTASGSLPPGIPDDFYGRLVDVARQHGAAVLLDTHGAPLREALGFRPHIVRLNHLEAQELVGGDAETAAHLLARELILRKAAEAAIVTLGAKGAIVATAEGEVEIVPPAVTVRSAVGAGDSFVGALLVGLARGWTLEMAARYGVAAAAAAVTTEATELCKADQVDAYFKEIGGVAA